MHLLFSTSRATLQALHPSDNSGLSAEVLQPVGEKRFLYNADQTSILLCYPCISEEKCQDTLSFISKLLSKLNSTSDWIMTELINLK